MRRSTLVLRSLLSRPRGPLLCWFGLFTSLLLLLVLLAFGRAAEQHVLERLLPSDRVTLVPTQGAVGELLGRGGALVEDDAMAALRRLPGVATVGGRQKLRFSAYAIGGDALVGMNLWTELVADGIDPALLPDDLRDRFAASPEEAGCGSEQPCPGRSCVPEDEIWAVRGALERDAAEAILRRGTRGLRWVWRDVAGDGFHLVVERGPRMDALATLQRLQAPGRDIDIDVCDDGGWCDPARRACAQPVPVIVHPLMLEVFNEQIRTIARGSRGPGRRLPRLEEASVRGLVFDGLLGRGFLGESEQLEAAGGERRVRLRVVGVSEMALPLGVTLPLSIVSDWNARYHDPMRAQGHDAVVVILDRAAAMEAVLEEAERELSLVLAPREAQMRRFIGVLEVVYGGLAGVLLVLLLLSTLHLFHTFSMATAERGAEFGAMRAVGARRVDIVGLVLAEALAIGLLGWVSAWLVFWPLWYAGPMLAEAAFGGLPVQPPTLFVVERWMVVVTALLACGSSALGALVPALRASHLSPYDALRS